MSSAARRVAEALRAGGTNEYDVLLMPDFYLDHMMRFEQLDAAIEQIRRAAVTGNGNAIAYRQILRPGGGATNMAHALARLGVRARLLAVTSPVGRLFLQGSLGRDGVDLSLVRDEGHLAVTGAIECPDASVMVYTPVPAHGLAPDSLTDDDWDAIARSDAVYVGDWSNPRAPDLAVETWRAAKQIGARTYTDLGPPAAGEAHRVAMDEALRLQDLDVVSLNDEEVRAYAGMASDAPLADAAEMLSQQIHARVDIHCVDLTASYQAGRLLGTAPRFDVPALQATGAGDVWNAGTMLGDLVGLDHEARLTLANALAALYVRSERVEPPWRDEVVRFLEDAPPLAPCAE